VNQVKVADERCRLGRVALERCTAADRLV